ncbi:MAG: hypothetical protein RL548_1240 [Bacteroidota bacterium]
MRGFVPQAGIEPARALRPTGFSYYYGFHHPTLVCSLDYAFTISFDLGAPCLVSTRSLSGFARYSHFKGFAEFTEFYIFNFSKRTQILFNQRTMSKSCVSTSSTTKASVIRLKKNPSPKNGIFGAKDRARTGHPDLGKVVLYQMSYFRLYKNYF